MQDVAEKLQELFNASSYSSWNELRDDVLFRLGKDFTPSAETIKQMHTPGGRASRVPDPIVLGTICSLYQQPVEAVSPEVADLLRVLKTRLGRAIDLRTITTACHPHYGSQDPLPFGQDEPSDVIDLREHRVAQTGEKEPLALYATAS